jgi:hypothetical protein
MKVHDGEMFQAEIRDVRFVGEPQPPVGEDLIDVFRELATSTWAYRAEPRGQWMVHDPKNARIVVGSLRSDVLTVRTI